MATETAQILFYVYSIILTIGPIGSLTYLFSQLLTQYHFHKVYSIKNKTSFGLLLILYIVCTLCGFVGFTLHLIKNSGEYCAIYGIALCFMLNSAAKSIMYYIFVERAKITNGASFLSTKKRIFFNYICPIYISIHWIANTAGTLLLFDGINVDPLNNTEYISYCIFSQDKKQAIHLLTASIWDLFNCSLLLYIFISPLCKMIHSMKHKLSASQNTIKKNKLLNVMKWNVILSLVATICSCLTLGFAVLFHQAIWAACMFEPFVNCTCCYFMMASNRNYCKHICCHPKPLIDKVIALENVAIANDKHKQQNTINNMETKQHKVHKTDLYKNMKANKSLDSYLNIDKNDNESDNSDSICDNNINNQSNETLKNILNDVLKMKSYDISHGMYNNQQNSDSDIETMDPIIT
eukprot:421542_1